MAFLHPLPRQSVSVGADEFQNILAKYSEQIERAAKRIAKFTFRTFLRLNLPEIAAEPIPINYQ